MKPQLLATVTGVYGALYSILPQNQKEAILASPGGRLRKSLPGHKEGKRTNFLVIGDIVEYEYENSEDASETFARITGIQERRNSFVRADAKRHHIIATNIDLVIIFITVQEPGFNPGFLDRALVEAENSGIPAILVINKSDLLAAMPQEKQNLIEEYTRIYRSLGYPVFRESFVQKVSLPLQSMVESGRSLLLGQSGVGKSTFLNCLSGEEVAVTSSISSFDKGRHTTTNPRIYRLSSGSEIIDLPGVKEYGLSHLSAVDLAHGFREMQNAYCKFDNCSHTHEPGCRVKEDVENQKISKLRYQSYLGILETLDQQYKPRKGNYWRNAE